MSGRTELGSLGSTLLGRITTRLASTQSTTPSRLATTVTPESRATMPSMPVPISGDRHQLFGRDVHQRDVLGLGHDHVGALAARRVVAGEPAALHVGVGLGDDLALLLERRVALDQI